MREQTKNMPNWVRVDVWSINERVSTFQDTPRAERTRDDLKRREFSPASANCSFIQGNCADDIFVYIDICPQGAFAVHDFRSREQGPANEMKIGVTQ